MAVLSGGEGFFILFALFIGVFLLVYCLIAYRRKAKWFTFNILGDFNNPHTPQGELMLAERFEKGVMSGVVYKSIWSLKSLFIINSIPDLNAFRFRRQLFAYKGASGETGDINYTFVQPPLIAKPSAVQFLSRFTSNMDKTLSDRWKKLSIEDKAAMIQDPAKLDEFLLTAFDVEWVRNHIGIVNMKREDILLREERVVHAAINSDNAGFAEAHKDNWQKLQQVINAMALPIVLIAIGLGAYFAYSGFQLSQQTTYGYDQYLATQLNQQITQTNALNAWLYAELKALNVYGIKPPANVSLIRPITNTSVLPTIPTTT